jgi:hypothetical protein
MEILQSARSTVLVRSPGFEPGSSAWEADVLARLDYDRSKTKLSKKEITDLNFYSLLFIEKRKRKNEIS